MSNIQKVSFQRTAYPNQPVKYWCIIKHKDGKILRNTEIDITAQFELLTGGVSDE
jgi:hypothetical protein